MSERWLLMQSIKSRRKRYAACDDLAEKEGFEPSIPFWGIHDFQSCALGQLRDFSIAPGMPSPDIIAHSP